MITLFMKLVSFLVLSQYLSHIVRVDSSNANCMAKEREALLALKHGFVDNYGILSSWSNEETRKDCCKWDRVQCNNQTGHVQMLDLHGNDSASLQVQGTMSQSLKHLRHLRYLDLSFTDFFLSQIPKSIISSLTNLRYLNLSYCYFGGEIPHEFGRLIHLEYLDLLSNFLDGEIPSQLSNLSSLIYLDLTFNDFSGEIPHQLGNLSSLEYLFVGPFVWDLNSNLEWVSHLSSSLRVLRMEQVDLSSATNWPKLIVALPHLQELHLSDCNLPNSVSFSPSSTMNLSKSLTIIDISSNNQTSLIYPWLLNFHSSLVVLKLTDNFLQGPIPRSFAKFTSLQELWLGDNELEGGFPKSLWDLCNLSIVRLNDNDYLSGLFDEFIPSSSQCAIKSLKILDLSWNNITGKFPNLSHLSYLQELYVDGSEINGTLSETIGHLSNLEVLSAFRNYLDGIIFEAHFFNLSKLRDLDLTSNALSFKFSEDWVPPFQLQYLYLSGCKLGPGFPSWLRTQKNFVWLDISSTDIADTVPQWFWHLSLSLQNINVSHNHLTGVIPNMPLEFKGFAQVDLSSNHFQGPIPSFLSTARSLCLSNNNFTDSTSLLCTTKVSYLFLLDLSNNQLSNLPDCWMNLKALSILNLADNNLFGEIPSSMGLLFQIQAIHLRNNHLSAELPSALGNCTELRILDVGHNNFSGPIPTWIGEKLERLLVLIMQSNQFHGTLPLSICLLAQIRIIDLSLNNLGGKIPSCVNNFTSLASKTSASNSTIGYSFNSGESRTYVYYDSASVTWKGKEWAYKNTLGLLLTMDFSSNKLVGEIPMEITHLVGLISLNLSRNMLSGKIPYDIGQLDSLDALDLSRNFLFDRIPSSLSKIPRLSVLDLSYNNLSGEIPVSTQLQSFNETVFEGNSELCGLPLPKKCPDGAGKQTDDNPNDGEDNDQNFLLDYGFYITLVLGFIVGFWGVCGTLALNRSWRFQYFEFLNDACNKLSGSTTKLHGMLKEFKERHLKRPEHDTQEVPTVIANLASWTTLEGSPKFNQYRSPSCNHSNNGNSKKNTYSSIEDQFCDETGNSANTCYQIRSSMPHKYCLESGIPSSSNLSLESTYEGIDEIVLTDEPGPEKEKHY